MPAIDLSPDEAKSPDNNALLDEYGEPYTLFPEEAEAVRELYTQAKQHNIKVHSIFELAQIVITSNLDRKDAFKRLERMRKFEEKHGLTEEDVWVSLRNVEKKLDGEKMWISPFPDNEGREVLMLESEKINFNTFSTPEDVRSYLHMCEIVGFSMITDLRGIRKGITAMGTCRRFKVRYFNVTLARNQLSSFTGILPIKLKRIIFLDVGVASKIVVKLSKGLISLFNAKLGRRLIDTSSKNLTKLMPKETLPKRYGGDADDLPFLEYMDKRMKMRMVAYEKVSCPGLEMFQRTRAPYDAA